LKNEEITERTLVLTMEKSQREKVLAHYENAHIENVYVLTDFVGDELEILDPYGGSLQSYGLCYETLRKSIKKLVKILN
jgi:protein-tyrosine phosphatase